MRDVLTIAIRLELSERHVRRVIREMRLMPAGRKGNRFLYSQEQFELIKKRPTKPGPKKNGSKQK